MKVTINLCGGLGNQIAQLGTLLTYCYINNYEPIILPIKESPSVFKSRKVYWDNFFHKLKIYFPQKKNIWKNCYL